MAIRFPGSASAAGCLQLWRPRMRTLEYILLPVASSATILSWAGGASSSPLDALAVKTAQETSSEWVFVANAGPGPVAAYPALASGPTSPSFTIENPELANTYWGPWGVAFDAQGYLY